MGKNKNKHVYLVGTDDSGYNAHSYDKKLAKKYAEQYKTINYKIKKVKNTSKLQANLYEEYEIYGMGSNENIVYITQSEEIFFYESFCQLKQDVEYSLPNFSKNILLLKFDDMENKQMTIFIKYVFNMMRAEEEYMENENDDHEFFNIIKAVKYFIKHVLDGR